MLMQKSNITILVAKFHVERRCVTDGRWFSRVIYLCCSIYDDLISLTVVRQTLASIAELKRVEDLKETRIGPYRPIRLRPDSVVILYRWTRAQTSGAGVESPCRQKQSRLYSIVAFI